MDSLSASEQRVFTLGVICATDGLNNIKVDYDKLAIEAGFKNAACASVLFNKAKRKLLTSMAKTGTGAGTSDSDTTKKAATGGKVTKPRKSRAKGKAGATSGADTEEASGDSTAVDTETKPVKAKGAKANGRGKSGAKVKADPESEIISIKQEAGIKAEPSNDEFAEGIIDGTFYPCTDEKLNSLWVAGAFSNGTGTTMSGSPLGSELDDNF
ncbi:hypothetical protein FQN49_000369 [Arthroderma sp. PD_2]|nr:hypothetical protein FQN49_000369 [Arthroderma sp. PD_2]